MFHIFLLSCLTFRLQTSSFLFDFHKVISCYYRVICLGFKTCQIYLRYINLCAGFQVVHSISCHWLRERGVVYYLVINTRHTPPYVPLTSILFTEQNRTHHTQRTDHWLLLEHYSVDSVDWHTYYCVLCLDSAIRSIIADSRY